MKRSDKSRHTGRRVQLHRALSKLGWGSRTQAWEWIQAGEVAVDGRVVTDPLTWVDLDRQQITRRGVPPAAASLLTLVLHKPRAIVTTRKDERGRPTVYDLLPADLPYVFPAGRLDADSEGMLILTNDSALAHRLTDPQEHVPKTYRVTIRGMLASVVVDKLRSGLLLPDSSVPTRPAQVEVLRQTATKTVVQMTLTEGRNRQVRRMWKAVGYRVVRLCRIAIGRLGLGDLPAGAYRLLNDVEIQQLTAG